RPAAPAAALARRARLGRRLCRDPGRGSGPRPWRSKRARAEGEPDRKGRSLAEPALHRHRATVGLREMLDNRESEARAAAGPGPGPAHAVEALEDVRQVLRGDALAGVADDQARPCILLLESQGDRAGRRRMADGIVDEIREHLAEPALVAEALGRPAH